MDATYRAEWVVPVDRPPIRDGAVVIQNGRFAWVGPAKGAPSKNVEELGNVSLLPGFINAHTHLELTAFHGRIVPRRLWDWFDELLALIRSCDMNTAGPQSVIDGAAMSLRAGVTCVGDISRTGINIASLANSPIRKVCFVELISGALAPPNDPESLERCLALNRTHEIADRLMLGVSPHAPYTVTPDHAAAASRLASRLGLPITTHFLETGDETAWFSGETSESTSEFNGFLTARRLPTATIPAFDSPVRWLDQTGIAPAKALLAHCNFATDTVIDHIARAGCSVAYCPRSHRFFEHPPHSWRKMLDAGVIVCLGTDSLACNDSLSILDEMQYLHRAVPNTPPDLILSMGTINSARALGLADRLGSITPGKLADMVAVPIDVGANEPIRALLESNASATRVWIEGIECR